MAAALAAVPYLVDLPAVQAYVTRAGSQALGRPVRYRSLAVSALPLPSVRIRGLEVSDDAGFGPDPVIRVEEGRLGLRLRALLSRRLELTHLTLEGLRLEVVEDAGGRLNLATLGGGPLAAPHAARRSGSAAVPGGPGMPVPLGGVTVRDGVIHYRRAGARPVEFTLERLALRAVAGSQPALFAFKGEAAAAPGDLRLSIAEGQLGPAGGRALGDVPLRATVELRAIDVGPLAALAVGAPTLSGPISGTLTVEGTPLRLTVSGALRVDRLVASQERRQCPVPSRGRLELRRVELPVRYSPAGLESAPARAELAGGTASAHVSVTAAPGLAGGARTGGSVLTLRELRVKGVELRPLLVDYLCQGIAITGPLELSGEARMGPGDPLRTLSGTGRLRVGPGHVVGADVLAALAELARLGHALALPPDAVPLVSSGSPLSFDAITASYRIADGVARTDDLVYSGRGFEARGAGTYGLADGRVEMRVTVRQGLNQVQALVTGTTPGRLRIVPVAVRSGDPAGLRRFIDRLLR